ncbi:MAG: penicillin-binding protein 2 [Gemmatimonadota bacterium]|nr:MAG: penicillin-binding protein 2 [Gemmatimonadota bacterium]
MRSIARPPQVSRRARSRLARWLSLLVVIGLGIQFFRIQILKHTTYALQSEGNRIRALPIPAARGTIYDRNGEVIAENVPGYSIAVLPLSIDSLRVVLEELAPILELSGEQAERLVESYRRHPNRPITVERNASFAEVSAIEERRAHLPGGIVVEAAPKRRYTHDSLLAHVVGYVAEISDADLKDPEFQGYEPGRIVGQTGVERVYDRLLAGTPGVRYVEVNALGRVVGEFRGREPVDPVPGRDLYLNIDLALQQRAAELFPDSMAGAVVALEPRLGAVLAMYSSPSYDPNAFVGGFEPAAWRALNTDPGRPLFNRAVTAAYAPGSTFKLIIAGIALKEGYAELDTKMPIPCRGALLYYGRVFHDWTPVGHGALDLHGAIRQSCDVYFYQLGLKIGLEGVLAGVGEFGMGQVTGIDLPSDISGTFPPSTAWYDERYGPSGWTNSVVLNLAIGQGENAQSPLKMVQVFAALANGGTLPTPRVARLGPAPEPAGAIPLNTEQLAILRDALVAVVNEPRGTARGSRLRDWTLAGKTGTAQNPHGEDHAWFLGFAPAEDPVIVAAAVVEAGGHGSSGAAPIVSRLIDFYLNSRLNSRASTPESTEVEGG